VLFDEGEQRSRSLFRSIQARFCPEARECPGIMGDIDRGMAMSDELGELIILTDDEFELDDEGKGWGDSIKAAAGRLRPVGLDPAIVQAQVAKFVRTVSWVFLAANAEVPPESGLSLEEVELAVKINSKGQVQLIAGGEAGAEAGITLKFKRCPKGTGGG
jgi:hypothetical protein